MTLALAISAFSHGGRSPLASGATGVPSQASAGGSRRREALGLLLLDRRCCGGVTASLLGPLLLGLLLPLLLVLLLSCLL